MPRAGKLEITRDKQSGRWVLNISAKLSETGKKRRLKFATKAEAEKRRANVSAALNSPRLKRFDEKLLETANYYDEAFQLYGFDGLADACATWVRELDQKSKSPSLLKLIDAYKANRSAVVRHRLLRRAPA